MIDAQDIQVSYGKDVILSHLSTTITKGKITTFIGANGCGKSTLLKTLTRILPLEKGAVYLDGQAIDSLATKEVAKKLALLPQIQEIPEGITVYELVSYGRYPHQAGLGLLSAEDKEKIDWALKATKTKEFAHLPVDRLSGGQRQCVWIALALAQDTETIFLDEPTTYLDLNHQLEVLELLQTLNRDHHKTIVMVLHDVNLSARFSDRMIAMKDGQICYQGSVADIMQADILRDIFQIEAEIVRHPKEGYPVLLHYSLL